MDLTPIAEHGYLVEGVYDDDHPQMDDLLAAAASRLVADGMSVRHAAHITTWQPGLVGLASWCDNCHAVPPEHPAGIEDPAPGCAARPVTIVNIEPPMTPEMIATRDAKRVADILAGEEAIEAARTALEAAQAQAAKDAADQAAAQAALAAGDDEHDDEPNP